MFIICMYMYLYGRIRYLNHFNYLHNYKTGSKGICTTVLLCAPQFHSRITFACEKRWWKAAVVYINEFSCLYQRSVDRAMLRLNVNWIFQDALQAAHTHKDAFVYMESTLGSPQPRGALKGKIYTAWRRWQRRRGAQSELIAAFKLVN